MDKKPFEAGLTALHDCSLEQTEAICKVSNSRKLEKIYNGHLKKMTEIALGGLGGGSPRPKK